MKKNLCFFMPFALGNISLANKFTRHNRIDQNYAFLLPALNLRYKDLSFDYTTTFTEPGIQYIQPVRNNTNLLYIQNDTPNLLPARYQKFNVGLYKYNPKKLYINDKIANDILKSNVSRNTFITEI